MVKIIDCKCGEKWQLESHPSEGSYRGHLACGICKRVIVTWEGPYYYSVQKVTGVDPKTFAAGTSST